MNEITLQGPEESKPDIRVDLVITVRRFHADYAGYEEQERHFAEYRTRYCMPNNEEELRLDVQDATDQLRILLEEVTAPRPA